MEFGILGAPGAHAMSIQEKREKQDNATTQHLKMVVPHVLVLPAMKYLAQVHFRTEKCK